MIQKIRETAACALPAETATRQAYRRFCKEQPRMPLFTRDWWLDAACDPEEHWDAAVVMDDDRITCVLPYLARVRWGMVVVTQPKFCPVLGPSHAPVDGKPATVLAKTKEQLSALIRQLPAFDHFAQYWDPSQRWWLPFFWNGFSQTTGYTYRLNCAVPEQELWKGLQESARREIRKATTREGLQVRTDLTASDLFPLYCASFQRQGLPPRFDLRGLERISNACAERNCGQILIAVDKHGKRHAGILVVWDESVSYYLLGGSDPDLRTSGAMTLCLWEAIRLAAGRAGTFDFEGSMIEPIERFFRGFGALPVPYSIVRQTPSRVLRTREFLLSMRRSR